jgi:GT2 family glycosyltransferase
MDASIILCTYNRCASLQTTLETLARQHVPAGLAWELLVVDNNSRDDTSRTVRAFTARLPMVRYVFERRQGKSHALNRGIECARGCRLLFTDDDVLVHPDWMAETLRAFERTPCLGVGGRILPAWSSPPPRWLRLEGPYALLAVIVRFDLGDAPCVLTTPPFGANMAFAREAFERYGGFRADLGPTAGALSRGEDTEFCRRLLAAGETLAYAPAAVVHHPVEPERATLRYFRSWYYEYGRALVRESGLPVPCPRIAGLPRYLLRSLGENSLRSVISRGAHRRAYYELQAYLVAGSLAEARRITRSDT